MYQSRTRGLGWLDNAMTPGIHARDTRSSHTQVQTNQRGLKFHQGLDTLHAPVSFLARMRTRAGVESDTRPRLAVLVDDPEYGQRLELDRSVLPKNGLRNRSPVPKRNPSSGR